MTQLSTNPASREQGSGETLAYEVSFAAALGTDIITDAEATLTDLTTGAAYPAGLGATTPGQTTVTQVVTALQAGHRYRLSVVAQTSGVNVWQADTVIACPN